MDSVLGVFKIEIKQFLEPKLGDKTSIFMKYRLFPLEILDYMEFNFPVKNEAAIIANMEDSQIILGDKNQPASAILKDAKKDTKKDVKKPAKKGGKEEEKEKKFIPNLELPIHPREKIYIKKNDKIIDSIKSYVAVKFELLL